MEDPRYFPKASNVIAALQALIEKHGDLPVCVNDADTQFRLAPGIIFSPAGIDYGEEYPDRIEITSYYHGLPEGYVEP